MPIELGVWRIDNGLEKLSATSLDKEQRLEDILEQDLSIASPDWMLIGRQVSLPNRGGRIDLLAMDGSGKLIVLELKRDMTPRDVVAQTLDYGSYVKDLGIEEVQEIFRSYQEGRKVSQPKSVQEAFEERFNIKLEDSGLEENDNHELVIVASSLDSSTERIINYLTEVHSVPINALFFRVIKDGDREYLMRVWFRDPTGLDQTPEVRARKKWNGEFYAIMGIDYDWDFAVKHGYIVAGGGRWYSRTLEMAEPGKRVWVNIQASGYGGVAKIQEGPIPVNQFLVQSEGRMVSIAELSDCDPELLAHADDPDKCNYLVRVSWIKAVSKNEAVRERGLFGNQNSMCAPTVPKWEYTVKRLKEIWAIS